MSNLNINDIVKALHQARQDWRTSQQRVNEPLGQELPSTDEVGEIIKKIKSALFPMRQGPVGLNYESENAYVAFTLHSALRALIEQARLELTYSSRQTPIPAEQISEQAEKAVSSLFAQLPAIRRLLDSDVEAAFRSDPAALNVDEVLLCYPGILAITHHRIAHALFRSGLRLLARMISELAHARTGIDIHPGAEIGSGFFIDHGTGVVIGETAVIGRNVRIYQAVTLGARRFSVDEEGRLLKGEPRHPILHDDVVVYSGASVLGRITIGKGASIGGNMWVTQDVPAGANVSQATWLQEHTRGKSANGLDYLQ